MANSTRGALTAIVGSLSIFAAQGTPAQEAVFRGGIDLVHLTATVVDAGGRFVTGLTRDDFLVYDDGVAQEIVSFSSDRVPVSVGLLLDVSGSMTEVKMASARAALDRFAFDLLDEEDELLLAEFAGETRMLQTWTRDRTVFRQALARANRGPGFGTSLVDAVGATLVAVATGSHARKALVVMSDGRDSSSRTPVRQVQEQIRRSEVMVYALGMDDRSGSGGRVDAGALRRLTDDTGGRTEVVRDYDDLDEATARPN
jgi:Ca-activated chloride channel homolog